MHLSAIQTASGGYSIVELGNLFDVHRQFGLEAHDNGQNLAEYLDRALLELVSSEASGVLLSPDQRFELIERKQDGAGLLLSLEKTQTVKQPDLTALPTLVPNWSVEHVRGNYGLAALELFYNPTEEQAVKKQQLVSELYGSCRHFEIDFLLKMIAYPNPGEADQLFDVQFEALRDLRRLASIIAVEFFEDPLHAATITTQLDVPWLVLERNVSYEVAKETIRTGVENGASGFVVSDVLWSDFTEWLEGADISVTVLEQYVRGPVRDRILELQRIVDERAG